ncbi:MAG: FG-GAP-like repeat-containing protein [Acidobacteriota bacterium]|nr:FG-GAP-like repeat-containing protein [Acidobacteriota bacterium]
MSNDSSRRPLGRRRRRLYRTIIIVVVVVVVVTLLSVYAFRTSSPGTYATGEEHQEITRGLSREVPNGAPEFRFVDVSVAAGLDGFRMFDGERSSQLPEDMGSGAAWGDYDNDGDEDLFLVSGGGPLSAPVDKLAPSVLYRNLGDGTFVPVEGFPEVRMVGMAASWADYNGDGRLDLVVSGYNALRLFRNDGDQFVDDPAIPSRDGYWAGTSWADFDRDGDLDLYVCGYVQYIPDTKGRDRSTAQYGRQIPYTLNPASYKAEQNLLFVNNGAGSFTESAEALGVSNPDGRSLGALWHDLNDDGWPDLYVANDISDNALYINHEGRLEDESHAAWVADYRGAMGLAVGDWNRDGDDDLFVTHWVAQENALYDSRLADGADQLLRFVDQADLKGLGQIALRSVGWGAEFVDLDADGWLDLVVANGSTFEREDRRTRLVPELPFLMWNDRGTYFHDMASFIESLSIPKVSRGLAVSDYDNDGDLDLLFVDVGEGVRLLRNDTPQNNWVQLQLTTDGARVVADVGDVVQRRAVSGVSYLSHSTRRLHIGLGDADQIDTMSVYWPSGHVDAFSDLNANTIWELREGDPKPRRLSGPKRTELTREQTTEFWRVQRAAMRAMKVDADPVAAGRLFEQALQLDPSHEDSIYYLGNCLAEQGDDDGALARFAELMRINPKSHRAFKRWGTLQAIVAKSSEEIERAEEALDRAVAINPEATGARMVLAEIHIVRGDTDAARQGLRWIRTTNPTAGDALFLLSYLAWKEGDNGGARELLQDASGVGEEWRPEGAAAEGDVKRPHCSETRIRTGIEPMIRMSCSSRWIAGSVAI